MELPNKPPRLKVGDRVCLVSPASTPEENHVEATTRHLESLGLKVELGDHIFDRLGYLAGSDEARLSDLNAALRNPGISAIIATRGGKGAYRIAGDLDFRAAKADPKLLVGFSEITILHLALIKNCNLPGIHGAAWTPEFGSRAAESFQTAAFMNETIIVRSEPQESTSSLTTTGKVSGRLIGGNQEMLATAAGWLLPGFEGAILLLEAFGMRLGQIDRHLTMLDKAGHLKGLKGIAVGQYTNCGPDATTQGDWTSNDVIRDRLNRLDVPILGGLPIGHGESPVAVPLGTMATLDTESGTLAVESAVK
jgi:muramoyltetrapeptide carboxypeptidase